MSALRKAGGGDAGRAYQALADPTRRAVLELLASGGPLRAGDIAAHFARLSRPAVSRHLRVLREAGLIEPVAASAAAAATEPGADRRAVWYRAEPAPLAEVEGWVRRYRAYWSDRLDELARLTERPDNK
jgi:DNA-binding transcriptional ArsR family regulator